MTEDNSESPICTIGPPEVSGPGREVFSFHLHRYLSGWLHEAGCERVLVTVGFDGSDAQLGAYRIDRDGAYAVRTGWTHQDLEDAWRFGGGRLVWEAPSGDSIAFEVVAVYDEPGRTEETTSSDILGFATVRGAEQLGDDQLQRLSEQVSEAICVARRNAVRLFFEEQRDQPVKQLLYAMMQRLPEWAGCDHSAAVLLTHDLDAMTLQDSIRGRFEVLAERIFFADSDPSSDQERLVGLSVPGGDPGSVPGDALRRYQDQAYLLYRRGEGGWGRDGDDEPEESSALSGWYELEGRPEEQTLAMIPLTTGDEQRDLLGFVTLAWSGEVTLPASVKQVLAAVGQNLGRLLRHSSLYTMSVRKLWVGRRVRRQVESAVEADQKGREVVEQVIGQVSDLVAGHVDVPSFAIGYLRGEPGGRTLRFVHPHGWTRYDDLELEVDVDDQHRVDSGVSALAIRLKRPVVLAGGYGEGADQEFKNYLWVDETRRELFDSRSVGRGDEIDDGDARPLRDYYKPARETAYATLAYPMVFSNRQVGVLTVEVDRSTDWLWWTGFGGHLFWDTIAREMAMGIYLLR